MKKYILSILLVLSLTAGFAQVGINIFTPNGALDITSATDGLLIPRVALTSTTIVLPVITGTESELVYNTATIADVTPGFYYLSSATGPWVKLGSTGWLTTGNTDIVDGTNFLGTTNNVDVAFRRNNLIGGKIGATNTSFGVGALSGNIGGVDNTAVGTNALSLNVGGVQNVAVGFNALVNNTGHANIGVGWNAGAANGGANNNIAIGFQALLNNTASNNTAIGFQALLANSTGTGNTAIGFQALDSNLGGENTAIGHLSLAGINNGASRFNTAIGYQAMFQGSGIISNCVAIGANALLQNRASNSTAIGYNALQGNTTSVGNTAVGYSALNNTGGTSNTALGYESGFSATGSNNTCIGYQAGRNANGSSSNTLVGFQAGIGTTGSNNIAIGNNAQLPITANSNQVRIGNTNINYAGVQVAWTITSDKRLKSNIENSVLGLDFIKTLRPVTYFRENDENKKTEYGFIAQEIEEAFLKAGDLNNGIISKDDAGMYAVRYNDFIPIAVKAIQEQQVLIEELQKTNAELLKTNAAILIRLEDLEKNNPID